MSGGGGEDRTEKPTPKRLREARRDGKIARTPELGSWGGLLIATLVLPMLVRHALERCERLLLQVSAVIGDPDPARARAMLDEGLRDVFVVLAPLGLPLLIFGVVASVAQGGMHPSLKQLQPKLSRLNPLQGFKRVFGPHALWEATKALVKATVVGLVLWLAVRRLVPLLIASGALPLSAIEATLADSLLSLIRFAALAGLVMAAADYAVARRRTNKQLKMTKHEVKQEHKQSEGDPHIRGAIRSRQLAMSRNRMMADLAQADVVVVNPTHVAVALRYDPLKGAPRVVAKGAGAVAAKIRERAAEHRIPLVQDVPLARALHRSCELGQEVPPELYEAVARVLAFVMSLKARGAAAGLHRPPSLAVPAR